jgi:hypothetical protein
VKERMKKDSQKEQAEAEAPIIGPGGFGGKLLLTQGGMGTAPPQVYANGTGMGMPPVSCSVYSSSLSIANSSLTANDRFHGLLSRHGCGRFLLAVDTS